MITLLAGNWKMNGSKKDLNQWFEDFFRNAVEFEKTNTKKLPTVLICVPFVFIDYAQELAKKYNTKTKQIKVLIGAQDSHSEDKGAFTGNISPVFLKEFGCKYVLNGHSERREIEKETSELIAKKAVNAIKNELCPVICVGETLETREAGKHLEFMEKELTKSIENVDLTKAIIAYEPVWAIGTGKTPSLNDIQEMNSFMKKVVSKKTGIKEQDIIVLYGGSVKSSNIAEMSALSALDGVLVGGASLKGEEFFNIMKNSL